MPSTKTSLDFWRYGRNSLIFMAAYLLLDRASYVYPLHSFNITPWNPPPALIAVLVMLGGWKYAPIVWLAILSSELVNHSPPPGSFYWILLSSLLLTVIYSGTASVMGRVFRGAYKPLNTGQLWLFIIAAAVGSGVSALVYVGILWAGGYLPGRGFVTAATRFWLGDTVGLLVTTPLLLVALESEGRRYLRTLLNNSAARIQYFCLISCLLFLMSLKGNAYFYLLFLPLIWIALSDGLNGAAISCAVAQVGIIIAKTSGIVRSPTVTDLQALMATATLTALFIGVMVDERRRAELRAKRAQKLAAAGEMAGAIAHELNQPLAALTNYARSCQLMLSQQSDKTPHADLAGTVKNMLQESQRAAEVVRRLRNLFRRGETQLEPVSVDGVLDMAGQVERQLNVRGEVSFQLENKAGNRTLLVDRLQIELVLRNLVSNAFDAVAFQSAGQKSVRVSAFSRGGNQICIRVADSGPGIAHGAHDEIFDPFVTNKASGMGLGLAIGLAVAEAHGGALTANTVGHGEFDLVLPVRKENFMDGPR